MLLCGGAAVIAADSIKARLRCGSPAYWAISLSLVPLTLLTSAITAVVLVKKHNAKNAAGQIMPAGEVSRTLSRDVHHNFSRTGGGAKPHEVRLARISLIMVDMDDRFTFGQCRNLPPSGLNIG